VHYLHIIGDLGIYKIQHFIYFIVLLVNYWNKLFVLYPSNHLLSAEFMGVVLQNRGNLFRPLSGKGVREAVRCYHT